MQHPHLVLKAGQEFKTVSKNKLDGEIWATPALTGGAIVMRTTDYLYKIESL